MLLEFIGTNHCINAQYGTVPSDGFSRQESEFVLEMQASNFRTFLMLLSNPFTFKYLLMELSRFSTANPCGSTCFSCMYEPTYQ